LHHLIQQLQYQQQQWRLARLWDGLQQLILQQVSWAKAPPQHRVAAVCTMR
jgi:hypothetical protein